MWLRRDGLDIDAMEDVMIARATLPVAVVAVLLGQMTSGDAPREVDWSAQSTSGGVGAVQTDSTVLAASQQRLMAQRAAELDAWRKLGEQVLGLTVTASGTVRDLVLENEVLMAELDQVIKGAVIDQVRHFPDGSCEVDAHLPAERVRETLTEVSRRRGDATGWQRETFEELVKRSDQEMVCATGVGLPASDGHGSDITREAWSLLREASGQAGDAALPAIYDRFSTQARLMAQRAAEVDAYRRLVEQVSGMRVTSGTTVENLAATSDEVRGVLVATLRGARHRGVRYRADGVVEVRMEVEVARLVTTLKRLDEQMNREGDRSGRWHETLEKRTERRIIVVVGQGVMRPGGTGR